MSADMKKLAGYAGAAVSLAAVTLVGIAIITGFKTSQQVDNDTADNFITGLAIFGTFMSVISLALVGKMMLGLVKGGV